MNNISSFPENISKKCEERRRHIRVPTDLHYSLSINDHIFTGQLGNISLSGAFLLEPSPHLNAHCTNHTGTLVITLNDEPLVLICEIVYLAEAEETIFPIGAGVLFSETDHATLDAITRLKDYFGLS
ncbi:hypothetical protein JCM14076_18460 [Methylosoma difficile]